MTTAAIDGFDDDDSAMETEGASSPQTTPITSSNDCPSSSSHPTAFFSLPAAVTMMIVASADLSAVAQSYLVYVKKY